VLRGIGQEVGAEVGDGARLARAHVLPRREPDSAERRGHDGEQRHS
jgi:hypothetical protein